MHTRAVNARSTRIRSTNSDQIYQNGEEKEKDIEMMLETVYAVESVSTVDHKETHLDVLPDHVGLRGTDMNTELTREERASIQTSIDRDLLLPFYKLVDKEVTNTDERIRLKTRMRTSVYLSENIFRVHAIFEAPADFPPYKPHMRPR